MGDALLGGGIAGMEESGPGVPSGVSVLASCMTTSSWVDPLTPFSDNEGVESSVILMSSTCCSGDWEEMSLGGSVGVVTGRNEAL